MTDWKPGAGWDLSTLSIVCYAAGMTWLILLALLARFVWRMTRAWAPRGVVTHKTGDDLSDEASPTVKQRDALWREARRIERQRARTDATGETEHGVPSFASAAYHKDSPP